MKRLSILAVALVLLFAAACSSQSGSNNSSNKNTASTSNTGSTETAKTDDAQAAGGDKVEITVMRAGITFTPSEFKKYFEEPIAKKYPNITVKWVDVPEDVEIEPLITQGSIPDIIITSTSGATSTYKDLDLPEDLTALIQKHNFDLNRLKPVVRDAIQTYSGEGQFTVLPLSINLPILYYNKDIFDKFGVPYPSDEQSSWEDIVALAKQLTKDDGGTHYTGIDFANATDLSSQLDATILDPATGKPDVTNDKWVKLFSLWKEIYDIPGYVDAEQRYQYANDDDIFFVDKTLAMLPHNVAQVVPPLQEIYDKNGSVDLNWDIAPYPAFDEATGTNKVVNVHSMLLTKSSKHKDEAFEVMSYILSDEVQGIMARNGRVPVIANDDLEKQFGADVPVLQGKKIENIFKSEPRKVIKPNKFESKVRKQLDAAQKDIALNGKDINSALRDAQAAIEKQVQELQNTSSK
jgi:ABC-type sugar transport system, periplasmic component